MCVAARPPNSVPKLRRGGTCARGIDRDHAAPLELEEGLRYAVTIDMSPPWSWGTQRLFLRLVITEPGASGDRQVWVFRPDDACEGAKHAKERGPKDGEGTNTVQLSRNTTARLKYCYDKIFPVVIG